MRLNTVNICADALIGVLSGTDALVDRQEKIAASVENAERAIADWVRGFAKSGGVDALMLNTNYHVSCIPCRTWDTAWRKLDGTRVTAEALEAIPHWGSRFVRAHEMGIEPYALALKYARESGMQCWFSVRMNEFHYLRWPETSATLWLEHPEYRQAADLPFDYRHEAVRRYYVDYIAELCRDYDIDGIELDMIRRFEPNADDSLCAAVTECVRAVRRAVDEISREKGKRILISARVYGLPEAARDHACEADLWAREGLVDGLTLSNFHTPCDYNLPVEQWRRLIGRDEVFIQAGCDFGNFGIMWNDIRTRVLRQDTASLRGFADAALNSGADGAYMFNLNTPDVLDFSALATRESILSGERRYILTKHDPGADYELPVSLDGAWHERTLNAGSGGENAVVRVGVDAAPESLEVRVNGAEARFIGRMQPADGRGYIEGVVWNDYARRIVDTLPEAAAYVAEFALPAVAAGAARVELRGLGGEVTWLEIAVGARHGWMNEGFIGEHMSEYTNISAGLAARLALEKHGFRFTHSLGQNFILDDALLAQILDLALIEPDGRVLEIGPGAGVMTRLMAERGADVTAIELDETLRPVLEDMVGGYANVHLVFADALKADLRALMGDAPFSVIANLPYYIATDLIEKLLTTEPKPRRLTVMVQKEAAERMTAAPGGKTWCALAAAVQYFARCEAVMELPPAFFTPPPHVDSTLLRLEPYGDEAPVRAADDAMMLRVIRAAFAMRRKTLANNLTAAFAMPREEASAVIESLGLDARVRGEALSIAQLAALSDALSAR